MDTSGLKKFAQAARTQLMDQVAAKLDLVLADGSLARREAPKAVSELEKEIHATSKALTIEKVAYTWFNRFCALRFMDANGYLPIKAVSPAEGQSRPELLAEAAAGHIDESIPAAKRAVIQELIDGRRPSSDAQGEAYRMLLVATCNGWHDAMPFLFEKIDDYTELLMPEDLLSQTSILARMREVMTEEACQDVEIIGWLYQFYISEKKDQVFAGLKKNQKITAENIPAATQLFTPHWIVRYLVENSLGRLWLLNRPQSKLAAQMDYYIAPEEPEEDFLKISGPEDIKVCDPACGSGHMLTYAFDLLYAIYEEEGFDPAEIPSKILTNNLFGIEIDERAGALAAFALTMKATARRKRFLRRPVQPQICVLENVTFETGEFSDYMAKVGRDLFTSDLRDTLSQFEQAKNFGSLIVPKLKDVSEVLRVLAAKDFAGDMLYAGTHEKVLTSLRMAEALSPKYHVVVANPPYMGGKGMNSGLAAWLKAVYPASRTDLMTCFMERAALLTLAKGRWGMINLPSWMFISSFSDLRAKLLDDTTISSFLHLGRGIFGSDFGSVAFVVVNTCPAKNSRGIYRRLFEEHVQVRPFEKIRDLFLNTNYKRYSVSQASFSDISGRPIAYWLSDAARSSFTRGKPIGEIAAPRKGNTTTDNNRFLRYWPEVSLSKAAFQEATPEKFKKFASKWAPYNKGGGYRKWYGFNEFLVNWEGDGFEIKSIPHSVIANSGFFFKPGWTWSTVTSGSFSVRKFDSGFIFDNGGCCIFGEENTLNTLGPFMNSRVFVALFSEINPTLNFQSGEVAKVPIVPEALVGRAGTGVNLSKSDWDAYETSWDFTTLPLLSPDNSADTLAETYSRLRAHWQSMTDEMKTLEEDNNRIFIEAYGLQEELSPDVPLEEITLTCNPAYRYGGKKTSDELEELLRADTMREFLHYAVGCMFGRYSLDEPGLILANQGDTLKDYLEKVPTPTFEPDADNVIPILDGDWFADDITERFRKFLRITFGEEKFQENLRFIEDALGKGLRKWFVKDFYDYHVRRYKKRPIYWMFSSPKGSFNALIYMHRYQPDTVSIVLNDYLREYRTKMEAYRKDQEALSVDPAASNAAKNKAIKEADRAAKVIDELRDWERDTLFPLATQKIEIDLDDGVKANYPKFGKAMKKIAGLEAKND
jgi:type II restriction/modification system DNA methylase subunit YeeA